MVLCKEEATSDKATDHVTHGGVPLAGCRGLTTGECAVKRLAPQPVVALRSLRMENTSDRHPEQQRRIDNVDVASNRRGLNPAAIPAKPHLRWNEVPSSPSLVPSDNFRPYFSSSLTLSTRGAVSPARHVLTRPRPHPVSRQESERNGGPLFQQECEEDRICPLMQSLS
jgi:hypothetical protein